MWKWTLNWDEIRPDLIVGSCPFDQKDLQTIQTAAQASAILSLQHEECLASCGIDYQSVAQAAAATGLVAVRFPMRDFHLQDQQEKLPGAVQSLARLVLDGHRVYVHCTAGINRSPLTVLGYLTFIEGISLEAALALIKTARPEADPYLASYWGCRADLGQRLQGAIAQRAHSLKKNGNGDPGSHLNRAEKEVVKETIINWSEFNRSEVEGNES